MSKNIKNSRFKFNISLSVLNHLGRNLYRNFITILGEALSNSWDADAENIWIEIDKKENCMFITDDGIGMNDYDFQNKFLKIGYSKRNNGEIRTIKNRPFIGRKGIGKLALLSCAEKIHIASKISGGEIVGGLIDNVLLDEAINDDNNSEDYILQKCDLLVEKKLASSVLHGTVIYFDKLTAAITSNFEYLRQLIAMSFRFSLIEENFHIHLNNKEITIDDMACIAENTQFVWEINKLNDPFLLKKITKENNSSIKSYKNIEVSSEIKGFVASMNKPSNIKIRGTDEKLSVDLFVNGRLREKDILKYTSTARISINYLYGQIHFNALDKEKDIFTSDREGILSNDESFQKFVNNDLKEIVNTIINDWDELRVSEGCDGDSENTKISPVNRKSKELISATINEISNSSKKIPKNWANNLMKKFSKDAEFNIPPYSRCFVLENLLRDFIFEHQIDLPKNMRSKIENYKKSEYDNMARANISIAIRQKYDDIYYLGMDDLSYIVDKAPDVIKSKGISRDAVEYKAIRNVIGHTSLVTDGAVKKLDSISRNIVERLSELQENNIHKK